MSIQTEDTAKWLRKLGAVRPMTVGNCEKLVLGEFFEGYYPIEWTRYVDTITRDFNGNLMNKKPIERWQIFGFTVQERVRREDCEMILRALARGKAKQ